MCVTAYMHLSTKGSRRQPHIPCNWSYRQLVAIQCEHSDLNSSPLQEQWTLIFNKPISYKLFLIFQGVFIIINKVSVKPIRKKNNLLLKIPNTLYLLKTFREKVKWYFFMIICVWESVCMKAKRQEIGSNISFQVYGRSCPVILSDQNDTLIHKEDAFYLWIYIIQHKIKYN